MSAPPHGPPAVDLVEALRDVMAEVPEMLAAQHDRIGVLTAACDALVRHTRSPLVWVGELPPESTLVRVVAWAGSGRSYIEFLEVTVLDVESGRGPAGVALRLERPDAVDDIANDPRMIPWRAAAEAVGYQSVGAAPIPSAEAERTALVCYAVHLAAFTSTVLDLLAAYAGEVGRQLDRVA